MSDTKRCSKCGEAKELDQFRRRADGTSNGARCRPCLADANREYRQRNPERQREWSRRSYTANRSQVLERSRAHYQTNRARRLEQGQAYREQTRDVRSVRTRQYRVEHADQIRERKRLWKQANPERVRMMDRAGKTVERAIRQGALVRPRQCDECGAAVKKISAAHADYGRPLDVRWLCDSCHNRWDSREPKTKAAVTVDAIGSCHVCAEH